MTRSGGTEVVGYRLYSSSSLAANSEIGVNQAIPITYTNSNNIALPLFGVALLTGFSPSGTYSDQLTVTLSWYERESIDEAIFQAVRPVESVGDNGPYSG